MDPLLLDKQSLHAFYGDATHILNTILNEYVNSLDGVISSLRTAFHQGNQELRNAAHFHSSAFSYVGLPQLYKECKALEEDCRQTTDLQSLEAGFEILLRRIEESGHLIKAELQQTEALPA